jgi:hypothetical protein
MNAADAFARTAQLSTNGELVAAGDFWRPRAGALPPARKRHRSLARRGRLDETLYGMMAAEQWG